MRLIPVLILLAACGIADFKLLGDLDEESRLGLCEELPARTVSCGDGDVTTELTLGSCEDLDVPAGCAVTAGDYRACYDAILAATDEELCDAVPSVCTPLFDEACLSAE